MGGGRGWRDRLGRFVSRIAVEAQRPAQQAQQDDRALIGDLIRAVDALAARCDALADRLETLERSVAEVVEVLGADLVHLRAEMADLTQASRHDSDSPPRDG
jgi:hypothetical protein